MQQGRSGDCLAQHGCKNFGVVVDRCIEVLKFKKYKQRRRKTKSQNTSNLNKATKFAKLYKNRCVNKCRDLDVMREQSKLSVILLKMKIQVE